MTTTQASIPLREQDLAPGLDAPSMRRDFVQKLFFELAKFPGVATRNDHYLALAFVVRDRLLHRWVRSARTYLEGKHRTVIYLSAEYLLGPQLGNNLVNLGIEPAVQEAMRGLGLDLDELIEHEEEPGLGNGGLGRLAACFMDSLATLDIPAIGHGIRYEFGIFDQDIRDGWQVERADRWLHPGYPWEVRRYEIEHPVGFGGHTEHWKDEAGRHRVRWVPERTVLGVPYDTPILGYGTDNANFLRLWKAVAHQEFNLDAFQLGQYYAAVTDKIQSENITKVLYPNDQNPAGKQLRLQQQYFFVSCALQDCIRLLLQKTHIREFGEKYAIQLNDTHPALAVAELMRLLMDEHELGWDEAWSITQQALSYTNHTLMPEALETWPLELFRQLLPRHLEIIYEINHRFLEEVRARFPGDDARARRMSLIDEGGGKHVRMAHLATVGGHAVNGVAALHSRLLRQTVLKDFAEMYPERFTNVTNGVTPRRFVALCNPKLTELITEAIGPGWVKNLDHLEALRPFAEDAAFRERWRAVKRQNKQNLATWLGQVHGRQIAVDSLCDAQCKRIHEYKRQHLNLLHVAWLCDRIQKGDLEDIVPRTVLFAGKAAPAYFTAKVMIRLATAIGETIARDPVLRRLLSLVFVPDFNVKNAQRIYPAADLSEQISTAGTEASGTGNMKFALNGALTIGTLDGANVEIRDAVGPDHFFLFGLTTEQIAEQQQTGYHPRRVLAQDPELSHLLDKIERGWFCPGEPELFGPLVRSLRDHDPYLVLADFRSYVDAQRRVARYFRSPEDWTRSSILNVAGMGRFSSDRSIRDYAKKIWNVSPVSVGPTT